MPSSSYLPLALSCKNLNNLVLNPETTEEEFISVLTKRKDDLKGLRILTDLSPKALVRIPEFYKLTSLDIQSADFKSFEILAPLKHLTRLRMQISPRLTKDCMLPPGCLSNLKSLKLTIDTEQAPIQELDSNFTQSMTLACPNLEHFYVLSFTDEDK